MGLNGGKSSQKHFSFFLFSLFCMKRFNNVKNWKKQTNKLFKMTCYNMNSSEWWERKENKKEENIIWKRIRKENINEKMNGILCGNKNVQF